MVQAQPLVPLLYNVGSAGDEAAATPESWLPSLHFQERSQNCCSMTYFWTCHPPVCHSQEGAMPGFTSGLRAELVMRTFRLPAVTPGDLAGLGVRCTALADK